MRNWGLIRPGKGIGNCWNKKVLTFEQLEEKRLLTIVWANEFATGANGPSFDIYGSNQVYARQLVNRAIEDWNAVISSFNYAEDRDANPNNNLNDTFSLIVLAEPLNPTERGVVRFADMAYNIDGVPTGATVRVDDNGGTGWFFDTTPHDDAEFTAIANPFHVDFINATTLAKLFFLAA